MSPSKFYEDQQVKREINGTRPSALKINKESHPIHKPSSSSTSSTSSSLTVTGITATKHQQHPTPPYQLRHPVIIYTHSPKVIHTKARDFMALVQKLTGLSSCHDQEMQAKSLDNRQILKSEKNINNNNSKSIGHGHGHDDTTSSSVLTDENCGGVTDVQVSSTSLSPIFDPINPYLFDIPLFTPSASDFFCSSRPIYRYPNQVFASPNMGSSISPSVVEVMKRGFQDY